MPIQLNFSADEETILMSRAGIDQDFLNKINQTVADLRNLKKAHPGVGTVIAHLTSSTGEEFQITVS
jgi:hypothetical protein